VRYDIHVIYSFIYSKKNYIVIFIEVYTVPILW